MAYDPLSYIARLTENLSVLLWDAFQTYLLNKLDAKPKVSTPLLLKAGNPNDQRRAERAEMTFGTLFMNTWNDTPKSTKEAGKKTNLSFNRYLAPGNHETVYHYKNGYTEITPRYWSQQRTLCS